MAGAGLDVEALLQRYLEEPLTRPGGRLERLLGEYVIDRADGRAKEADGEVDALLLRYVLDKEDVGAELVKKLEGRSDPALQPSARCSGPEDLVRYVREIAAEDEALHAMTSDESSTLRGIPPGGSSPIPPLRRRRRQRR